MQTLDLSGESKKSDGRLKSLFWPTVENAWDVDYLGQQGFWICVVIGILNFAMSASMSFGFPVLAVRIVLFFVGVLALFVYWVGGMGVREHSFAAALTVFVIYVVGVLAQVRFPGVIPIIIGAVLLSNVRATFLASQWRPASEDEDRPMRFNDTLRDKLVDQIPPRAWPVLRYPFYIASSLLLVLMIFGAFVNLANRRAQSIRNENSVPSAVVVASPDFH